MEDREIVAAVAAGDPAGLAGAYDTYAETLYGYCHWMLAEPGDAAQAVQDTFVLAAGRPVVRECRQRSFPVAATRCCSPGDLPEAVSRIVQERNAAQVPPAEAAGLPPGLGLGVGVFVGVFVDYTRHRADSVAGGVVGRYVPVTIAYSHPDPVALAEPRADVVVGPELGGQPACFPQTRS